MQTAKEILQKLTYFRGADVNTPSVSTLDCNTVQTTDGRGDGNRMNSTDLQILRETVYDLIKDIGDPEKPQTLSELDVVCEDNVLVREFSENTISIQITFVPTVPHCSLAALIGLCIRKKLTDLPEKYKNFGYVGKGDKPISTTEETQLTKCMKILNELDIFVKEGTHDTADEINKQINDKERIAAAMENPNLRDLVDKCINFVDEYG